MKIALLPSAYHPSVGGVEELTRHLGLELVSRGHEVRILTSRRDGDDWSLHDVVDGLPVVRSTFPAPRSDLSALLHWPGSALREYRRLSRVFEAWRPDLLHVQCFSTNGAYATALSRLTGIPLVVTLQGETVMDDHDAYDHSTFLRTALRAGLRQASAVTGCSQFTVDDAVSRFGPKRTRPQVIFNGVDLTTPVSRPVDLPFERFVLAMGRVVPKKGFDLLLRAWARVESRHPDVGLVIAGRGPQRAELEALTIDLGLTDRVHFPGVLTREQVSWATRRSKVFAMPSRVEPFGIVALEGWRGGAAVLVSSRGGAGEFVRDGIDGLVVDPFDEAALAASLDRLLNDDDLRARLAASGERRVREFSWPAITDRYVAVYEDVLR